jgi:hypothetical protein
MGRTIALKTALALASMLAFSATHAAGMSKEEHKAAEDRIEAEYKSAKAACDGMKDNAKDICNAEAKAKQKVAKAELDAQSSGKPADRTKVAMTRAEANYEIAKEKCDDLKGNDKDVCMKQAKATETKAKADAKAAKETSEARKDASEDKRDADYKAARERCDSMSGDAKDTCVAQVKARYGKG